MCKISKFLLGLLCKLLLVALGFFAVTFTMYFFNLDMKMMTFIEPLFAKHYDSLERKHYI